MSHENPDDSVWIEAESWAPGEWTPDDGCTDVIVTCKDGGRWIATFISYQYVKTLTERNRRSGENIAGAYLWIRDMILIDETSRQRIEEVINDLIDTGDFELVFRRVCSNVATGFSSLSAIPAESDVYYPYTIKRGSERS